MPLDDPDPLDDDVGYPVGGCHSGEDVRLEARCPSCGVILTSAERGVTWPIVDRGARYEVLDADSDPLCERCRSS